MKRLLAPILLIAAAPGLSGCVALAVPVATGLVMGGRMQDDARSKTAGESEQGTPASEETDIAAATGPVETGGEAPGSDAEAQVELLASSKVAGVAPYAEMPAPSGVATVDDGHDYTALFAKVTAIAQRDPFSEEKRLSAMLANPADLKPDRAECAFAQTAVLVDLDPGEEAAPLDEDVAAAESLVRVLATLRAQEVAVLWLSRHTAVAAGAVRRMLLRTGLDPRGTDELYLVRYETESKATRRADAAKDYCVVAIVGDQKGDFDELFAFLKDEKAAFTLDPLIGEAWFIAPPPLSEAAE
tara:strand:+ start:598 stop:1497 length:900 start_codon:yes stop_codon:yes gene_type:complete